MGPMPLVDLHVHLELPVLGAQWRKRVQRFFLGTVEQESPNGSACVRGSFRLYGLTCYQTFVTDPLGARARLFKFLEEFPRDTASLILSSADLDLSALSHPSRREAFLLTVESLRYLQDPTDLRALWDYGVRSLQPIHFLDTPWGRSSKEGLLPQTPGGLTGLGREMLAEMARLGFILDLAHMNFKTAEECLAGYPGAVMCSHTGLHEIRPSARNLTADLAREIFNRGGAVGVTCWRQLLGTETGTGGRDALREGWTRAICATAAALAALAPGARVAVGSDRGAPIRAPGWLYSEDNLREMETCLAGYGWGRERFEEFLWGSGAAFLREALAGSSA